MKTPEGYNNTRKKESYQQQLWQQYASSVYPFPAKGKKKTQREKKEHNQVCKLKQNNSGIWRGKERKAEEVRWDRFDQFTKRGRALKHLLLSRLSAMA